MLVDSDTDRLSRTRQWIEWEGGPEAETASTGDEALDILGGAAQRFDIVAIWPWLADDATVDVIGIPRRCNSPVRLVAVTERSPAELGRAKRLAGVAAVEDSGEPRRLIATFAAVLEGDDTVAAIVASGRVPLTLSPIWSRAIYGAAPGQHFLAPLD